MHYSEHSIEGRLLRDDPETLGLVMRWISTVLTGPRFWSLREEWPDLLQETLARLIESLRQGRFDNRRDFCFYVQGIARHSAQSALGERRPLKATTDQVEGLAAHAGPTPDAGLAGRQLLRRVMDLASEECRLLIRAYYLEEMSYQEIAAELDLPVGTVKSRLSRCLEGARRALHVAVPRPRIDGRARAANRRDFPEPRAHE